jgi:shikimate dehydrogenase
MTTSLRWIREMLEAQSIPTLYFIGVTTKQSSIMRVFPQWSAILGLGAQIVGYDAPLHAPAETYRQIVQHIKDDPLSFGALVTTHKIDLLAACRDLFDVLDPYAELCGEISCISKANGLVYGHAKDPITSGLALQQIVADDHWSQAEADVFCIGAGGAAVAISVYLAEQSESDASPKRFIVSDIRKDRLDHIQGIHAELETPISCEYHLTTSALENDVLMADLPSGSLVINATGLGKDRPGSPLSGETLFPMDGIVWELNYRGTLEFLKQATHQTDPRRLTITDGWVYFLHGWSQVIAEVFKLKLTPDLFTQLDKAASVLRPGYKEE